MQKRYRENRRESSWCQHYGEEQEGEKKRGCLPEYHATTALPGAYKGIVHTDLGEGGGLSFEKKGLSWGQPHGRGRGGREACSVEIKRTC